MDMIVTPDCPQCGGKGMVPFDRDSPNNISQRPCGQCCRRYDLANPIPSPKFMATNMTMAQFAAMLRGAKGEVRGALTDADAAGDVDLFESYVMDVEWMLRLAADFVASHDPSTKVRLSEAEAPFCRECECDHVPDQHAV